MRTPCICAMFLCAYLCNAVFAQQDFLLRCLVQPVTRPAGLRDANAPAASFSLLLYSVEDKKWQPPLNWKVDQGFIQLNLPSDKPYFVRLQAGTETLDLGYVDFAKLLAQQEERSLLTLYLAKRQRAVPVGKEFTRTIKETVTKELPFSEMVLGHKGQEIVGKNPVSGQPANFDVTIPYHVQVTKTQPEQIIVSKAVKEIAGPNTTVEEDYLALGLQEFIPVDHESLPPAVKQPPFPEKAAPLPGGPSGFYVLNAIRPNVKIARHVWLYSTKEKDWLAPSLFDPHEKSGSLPLAEGLHYLRVASPKQLIDVGYLDFSKVSKEQKNPVFVLDNFLQSMHVRQGQQYLRPVKTTIEVERNYSVLVPLQVEKETIVEDPETGKKTTIPAGGVKMVSQVRTMSQQVGVLKTEKVTAPREEDVEFEMIQLSFLHELEVDRQQAPPAPPTPNP